MLVLIYDGDCNMCSRFIRFILDINTNKKLKITDFESQWTKNNYKVNKNIDSMIFIKKQKQYIYSDAVIHLLMSTHYIFKPLFILKLVPKIIRDNMYKFVAKRRRKILKSCNLGDRQTKDIFLKQN
ncbi:thiol-disulfide oxidoreductase DCC family protein [Peribacillus simplex]|uniref:DUF393 domain-containing protein n=1 Tax=Peribacillus simplex TaxID=1478 RepID=A0AAW7IL39_9BACI|nr:DUF393 domain-containing protein [Peribacillus simplex]MDM5450883.1 DUF393 domain-containing protein [Peribacillus simplex]